MIYFHYDAEADVVRLQGSATAEDGTVAEMRLELHPGEAWAGHTFEGLRARGSGTIDANG